MAEQIRLGISESETWEAVISGISLRGKSRT